MKDDYTSENMAHYRFFILDSLTYLSLTQKHVKRLVLLCTVYATAWFKKKKKSYEKTKFAYTYSL